MVVVVCEICVDGIKHAFITKFNELPLDVYKDYIYSLAYDIAQTHQKHVSITSSQRYINLRTYLEKKTKK